MDYCGIFIHCRTKEVLLLKGMKLSIIAFAMMAISTLDNENCLSANNIGLSTQTWADSSYNVSSLQLDTNLIETCPENDTVTKVPVDTVKTDLIPVKDTWVAQCTWYGESHHGNRTASGSVFNMNAMTAAASSKIPFGSKVKVTNRSNGKSVVVTITDRGSFSKKSPNNMDLSYAAFKKICNKSPRSDGRLTVKFELL